jgi:hypothetical protein
LPTFAAAVIPEKTQHGAAAERCLTASCVTIGDVGKPAFVHAGGGEIFPVATQQDLI